MTEEKNTKSKTETQSYLAVIRIRGGSRIDIDIKNTLEKLNLKNQHNLVILPNKPNYVGMLKKAKDYITWGVISPELKKELEKIKSEIPKKNNTSDKIYKLHPPVGGFRRKGIKQPYHLGGVLGNREDKINDLIKRMTQ